MKEIISKFTERLSANKRLEAVVYSVLLILAAVIFFISGGISCEGKKAEGSLPDSFRDSEDKSSSITEDDLERRLESILSHIAGAGNVSVMITYETSREIVPAQDNQKSITEGGSSEISKPVTVTQGGNQCPIVLTELMPKIRGVIVVAEGANDLIVRSALENAVTTVLGIEAKRISVFSMKTRKEG